MRIGIQQICSKGSDNIAMAMPDLPKQVAPLVAGNPVELALQHGDTGFGVDSGRADILMAEEFLDIGDVHAFRQQPCRHRVAQQMRVDAFFDPGPAGDISHHLADTLASVDTATGFIPFTADKERPGPALADMNGNEPGKFGADRNLSALATLAALNDDDAFGNADILDTQGDEFRDARAGLQQSLDHQAGLSTAGIGGVDEAQRLLQRQTRRCSALFLWRSQSSLRSRRLEHGLGLNVVDALTDEDVGDLVGEAVDIAGHRFVFSFSRNKSTCRIRHRRARIQSKEAESAVRVFLSVHSGKPGREGVMRIEIRLRIDDGDGITDDDDVLILDKPHDQLEQIGLSLDEAKDLLGWVQERIVGVQAAAFVAEHRHCAKCGSPLRSKGKTVIRFRTPFGDVPIASPRLHRCACDHTTVRTFSPLAQLFREHVAPEMLYLEMKWASLVSFGVTVNLLKDVLPVGTTLNAETVRNHLHRIANRAEAELGDERTVFAEGCLLERARLPLPEGPIVVGVDGGYVRAREPDREGRQTNFEVMVGKSMAADRGDRYFGLVQSFDKKPRRRLYEVLRDQGFQMNQEITFLTDGGDSVRNIAFDMSPCAEHILDWFHITMRLTVMRQYAKGLAHYNESEAVELEHTLKRIKGFLWNGNTRDALMCIRILDGDLFEIETDYSGIKAFRKCAAEFHTYITRNVHTIPNYAERYRYGERVSTAFVESTVNTVIGKRFAKRQQMRWSKRGAHLLLQTRTRVLDGTLRIKFEEWYPGLAVNAHNQQPEPMQMAA